jgi:hypothetical protein
LRSGSLLRIWRDELPTRPPFNLGPDTLFVAYMAAAELACFAALGWPMPRRVLDPYVEFRALVNGRSTPHGKGLLGALSFHGIPGITAAEKAEGRGLVMRGGPWSDAERRNVLDYCQTDVDPLGPLLEQMLPRITAHPSGLAHALLRGRYMAAVARMEHARRPGRHGDPGATESPTTSRTLRWSSCGNDRQGRPTAGRCPSSPSSTWNVRAHRNGSHTMSRTCQRLQAARIASSRVRASRSRRSLSRHSA